MPDDLAARPAPALRMRADFQPSTWNAEARTVDVIFTTGADVTRRDFWTDKRWIERLDVSEEAIDLARLEAGAPVLDTHSTWSLGDVVGVVERAWIKGGKGYATIRFSDREEVAPIVRDVAAGILRNISVGYVVDQWQVTEATRDGAELRIAKRWTPYELSLVPVPADPGAQVRSGAPLPPAAPPASKEPAMDKPDPAAEAARTAELDAARTAAIAGERTRMAEIMTAQRAAGLDADWAERMIADPAITADAARKAALDEVAKTATKRVHPATQRGESGDDPAMIARAMGHAMAVRFMPSLAADKDIDARFREFSSMADRPSDMLMELAAARGERVGPRDRQRLIDGLFARNTHTSGDFPLLLEAASNKMLMAAYGMAPTTYKRFFAQKPFKDFKAHKFLTVGDFPALAEVNEAGEITAGSMTEKRETITAKTYGRQFRFTRQMMINDDLGAFGDWVPTIGRRVAADESTIAYALVNTASGDGPTLVEGTAAVFTTGRANKASSGGAISESTLDTGYAAMMAMTNVDGTLVDVTPRILLTGAAYRGAAIRYTTRIAADSGANVGAYSDLEPVSDGRVTGNRWYLFADPALAPVYVYGYVNGQTEPQIRAHPYQPGTDGLTIDVVHDFAAGAVDFRGGYFNPGA